MKTKSNQKFEIRMYIGSRRGYTGDKFTLRNLKEVIAGHQIMLGLEEATPVRITKTCYLWQDYQEKGWEIGIFNYPRRPLGAELLKKFALTLGEKLLAKFGQNRITIEFPDETLMLEADNAEQKHK